MKQRSLLIFEESIKSPETLKNYTYQLDKFLEFTKIQDYDSLTKVDKSQLQEILEDYVMHLKKTVSPNSVGSYMTGLRHFFVMNKVRVYWEILSKMYPEQVKRSGQEAWTNEDIQRMLEFSTSQRNKAIVLFMASTGTRIGIHDYPLQMQHLVTMEGGCKAVLLYAGDKDEYWSFLTPETSKYLDEYLEQRKADHEKFYPDTPVFRHTYRLGIEKAKQLNKRAVISMIFRLIRTAKTKRVKVNSKNYDKHMDHAFRKRFNTILKINNDVNSNIAEKLMAHKNGLDGVYFVPTREECFTEFQKAIPFLTISDEARLRFENNKKQHEIDGIEKKNLELQELAKRVDDLENGPKARWNKFFKDSFDVQEKPGLRAIFAMFQLWFEMRATEDEKQIIWKKLQGAIRSGKTLNVSEFGESKGLRWNNLYSE